MLKSDKHNSTCKMPAVNIFDYLKQKLYIYSMKSKLKLTSNTSKILREQILNSMIASFKIEGITISDENAKEMLKKIEPTLGK